MLYKLQKKDIKRAAEVLANAFTVDPIWNKVCEDDPDKDKRFRAIFEVAVRQGLRYGEIYATSEDIEGIISWVPGMHVDMSLWQMIRSGSLGATFRIGWKALGNMGRAYKPVTEYRRKHMDGLDYLYLLVFGVATEHQGKGYGRSLINAALEAADRAGLPLYLGAGSDDNVAMYEHFGFEVVEKIHLPAVDLYEWEMVRQPQV